ncbi:MAG: MarR family transcriptional regulator [Acidimicrobiaceae bacterium]|nr:MarR family transcriptional regulator [Acidimicrobiaceae bacterium]
METITTAQTATRLRRAITRLNRRLRYSALGGVSPAQASMLATIELLDQPSLGDLAVAEQIQPPSVTRLVRTLEQAQLLRSWRDAEDRRCTRVQLSDQGHEELETIRQRKTEFLERKLISLSSADQKRAEALVTFLERLLEDE